jgi:hypothetical protein
VRGVQDSQGPPGMSPMPLYVKARSLLRNLFWSRGVEADLDQEVHAHLELLTEEGCVQACRGTKRNARRGWNLAASNR